MVVLFQEKKIYLPSSTSEYDILLRENEHLKVLKLTIEIFENLLFLSI